MKAFLFDLKMIFFHRSICFLFLVSSFLNTFVSATQHLCHPDQRDALLVFKNEFRIQKTFYVFFGRLTIPSFVYPKTRSWVNKTDCCSWDGITCDAKSGKVIGLDLSFSLLHGQLKFNSSLFRLRHLRDLNLAYNNFTASPIPAEFDKLKEIKRLNLSKSCFSGQIPTHLLQLTKLVSLDLSYIPFNFPSYLPYFSSMPLYIDPLSIDKSFLRLLARNLRNLSELDMSSVNISSEIPHEFSNMRSLRFLHLVDCNLFGEFPSSVLLIPNLECIILDANPNLRGNLPAFLGNNSLLLLSIHGTAFSGTIPDSITKLKHLTSLTLSKSHFSGKIPFSLGNLSHLFYLDLFSNNFVGEIPSSIGNLKKLAHFDVSNNNLSGNLPARILNFTQLFSLSLGYNQFTGTFPPNSSQLSKLDYFTASHNFFTGAILSSLLMIPSLTYIELDYNQHNNLLGIENIFLLPNLQFIYIYHNSYNKVGPVDLNVFSPLKQLRILSLSDIPLSTANITLNLDFPSNFEFLELPGCNITEFPEFIRYRRKLSDIDLSNNKIKGQVPDWFWRLPELYSVDVS